MKSRMVLLALLSIGLSQVFAADVKQLACKKTNGAFECVYEVKGQVINQPDSVSNLYGFSNMPYALCSSALCKVEGNDKSMATCHCNVFGSDKSKATWHSASVGPKNYKEAQPEYVNGKLKTVMSTFSFANLASKKDMHSRFCSFAQETGWANCFGIRCSVSSDGKKATCQCPIVKTTAFLTMGAKTEPECHQPASKAWSAATIRQADNDFAVIENMYKAYYPNSPMNKQD